MVSRMLIVRGVRTTRELEALGLTMAQRYQASDIVVLVGHDGRGLVVKGAKETTVVELYDADSPAGRCMRAVRRVQQEAAKLASIDFTETSMIGMFLYYWPVYLGSVDVVIDAIEQGDAVAVEQAADLFIAAGCGTNLAALSTLSPNADRSDAGGHAADGAPG